jgi:MFS family permease
MPAVPLRRNRDFMLFQSGQLLSNTGTQVSSIAYPLLVLSLTHSAVRAGVVALARTLPMALLSIPAGVAADHWSRRALMIGADVVRAGAVAFLAVSVAAFHPPFWVIVAVASVEGAGAALFNAAQAGAVRAVVPPEQLADAAGAQSGRTAAVRIVGPPLGGALFEAGRALPFVVDACSYAFSTVSLLFMRARFQEDRARDRSTIVSRVREGLAYTWSVPFVRITAFLYGFLNFTALGLVFCVVVIGERQGLTGGAIGLLTAVFAGAVLLGSLISPALRRVLSVRAVLLLELWAWTCCVVFVVWPSVYALALGLVPVGLAIPSTDSVVNGYRIAITPDRLLGRAEAVRNAIALSVGSAAPLLAGILLQSTSERLTIGFFAVFSLALAVWGTCSPSLRDVPTTDLPAPAQ